MFIANDGHRAGGSQPYGGLPDCEGVGFPLWQLDPRDQGRNAAELRGTIRLTEDMESGFLVMRDPALADVGLPGATGSGDPAEGSPWGGLSGALVFCQGMALGVVVEHHRRQGGSAIRILPVDRLRCWAPAKMSASRQSLPRSGSYHGPVAAGERAAVGRHARAGPAGRGAAG